MGKKSRRNRPGAQSAAGASLRESSSSSVSQSSNSDSHHSVHHKSGSGSHSHHKLHSGPVYNKYHPHHSKEKENSISRDGTTMTTVSSDSDEPAESAEVEVPAIVVPAKPTPTREEMTIEFAQHEESSHHDDTAFLAEEDSVQPAPKLFVNAFTSVLPDDNEESVEGGADDALIYPPLDTVQEGSSSAAQEDFPAAVEPVVFQNENVHGEEDDDDDDSPEISPYEEMVIPMPAAYEKEKHVPLSLNDTQETEIDSLSPNSVSTEDKEEEDRDTSYDAPVDEIMDDEEDTSNQEANFDQVPFLGDIDSAGNEDSEVSEEDPAPLLQQSEDTPISRSVDLSPPTEATTTPAVAGGPKDPPPATKEKEGDVAKRWLRVFVASFVLCVGRRLIQFYYGIKRYFFPPGKYLSTLLLALEVILGVLLTYAAVRKTGASKSLTKLSLPKLTMPKFIPKRKKKKAGQEVTDEELIDALDKGSNRHDVIGAEYSEMEAIMEEPTNHSDVHEDALEVRSDKPAKEAKGRDEDALEIQNNKPARKEQGRDEDELDVRSDKPVKKAKGREPTFDENCDIPKSLSVDSNDDAGRDLSDLDTYKDPTDPILREQQSPNQKKKRKNIFSCLFPVKGVKKMIRRQQSKRQAKRAVQRASAVYKD